MAYEVAGDKRNIPHEVISDLLERDRYLSVHWDPVSKVYRVFLQRKHLFKTKDLGKAFIAKLDTLGFNHFNKERQVI